MIANLLRLTSGAPRAHLRLLIVQMSVAALLQGLAFVLLVPILEALFSPEPHFPSWALISEAAILGCYVFLALWMAHVSQQSASEIVEGLEGQMGDRLVELPLGYFNEDRVGQLTHTATRGVVFAASAPYAILRQMIAAFVTPAVVMVGTWFVDWRVGLTMTISVPILFWGYRWIYGRMQKSDRAHVEAVNAASSRVIEYAQSQPAIRAAGKDSVAQKLVRDSLEHQHDANHRNQILSVTGISTFGVLVQALVVAVIVQGTYLVLGGSISLGVLAALLVLVVRFAEPITAAAAMSAGVGIAANTLEHIQGLHDEAMLPEPNQPVSELAHYGVEFDNVTFGYGSAPVVSNISFTVPEGSTTAIVGPSGSGKTTITRLIPRFYDPEEGTVKIGGVALGELGSVRAQELVAPVFQDVYLFDDSVFANVQMGRPDASREEVLEAARLARVDEIIERLPNGWDTPVGEGGASLSGGERQRVSIARALLKDAPIVVLDEATAALDAENERAITDAIAEVTKARTVVIVAHRLQTITKADQIIMLTPNGTIAEQGTHEELLDNDGPYARFWEQKLNAVGWRIA